VSQALNVAGVTPVDAARELACTGFTVVSTR
jgi:hypothetical protein